MHTTSSSVPLLKFENLSAFSQVIHFVTTRHGGTSAAPYDSLNLGLHTADNPFHVHENRNLLAAAAGIEAGKFLYASQVHSGDVKVIDQDAVDAGVLSFNPRTDATITDMPDMCLMVMVADCVPLLLFDPVKSVIGVVHAGWRGTVQNITVNTVRKMQSHYGCDPADLIAGIGPSIGPCCYEVGDEVRQVVEQALGTTEKYLISGAASGKLHFDLWYANTKQLADCGVKLENIEVAKMCTRCRQDLFFSSRASKGITGRFSAGIYLMSKS